MLTGVDPHFETRLFEFQKIFEVRGGLGLSSLDFSPKEVSGCNIGSAQAYQEAPLTYLRLSMTRLIFSLVLMAVLAIAAWQVLPGPAPETDLPVGEAAPVAVVELFTSEGCSSCPPADRLLARVAAEARQSNDPVFTLSFHVDYWNYLGWADPYSDPAFSARQRAYSQALGETVYTPQMIINGRRAFVGSDAAKARRDLAEALRQPASVTLAAGVSPVTAEGVLLVSYAAPDLPADAVVHLAVVERGLSQRVTQGENTGRTLGHENVVRVFETLTAPYGKVHLNLPEVLNLANASLIVYAQDVKTMAVLGATGIALH